MVLIHPSIYANFIDLRERRRKNFLLDVMHLDHEKLSQSSATDNSNCVACQMLFTSTNQFCQHLLLLFQIRTQSTAVSARMCVYVEPGGEGASLG